MGKRKRLEEAVTVGKEKAVVNVKKRKSEVILKAKITSDEPVQRQVGLVFIIIIEYFN